MINTNKARVRIKRPFSLIFFGIFFILLPVINYASKVIWYGVSIFSFEAIYQSFGTVGSVLLLLSIIVGIGLLIPQKWGWFAFVIYAPLLITYNAASLINNQSSYNIGALIQSIIAFLAIGYFLQRDKLSVYLNIYPRGWRLKKRKEISIPISINDKFYKSKNIGVRGVYILFTDCPFSLTEEVNLKMDLNGKEIATKGGVARIDQDGVGIAYRNMDKKSREMLARFIKSY